jgi:ABC-type branched-subunit amino acid transport system ATPase component/ABC-type branched-subunit amino acid transport system permease subunit
MSTGLKFLAKYWLERGGFTRTAVFVLLLAAGLPLVDGSAYHLHVVTLVFMYMALSLGLNLMTGLAGLVDLGYIAFFAVGAYGYALLSSATGLPFVLQLPLLSLIATGFGIVLGLPTLRVRGDYLAIVTLGFGEIVRLIATNWASVTNGAEGLRNIPGPWVGITLSSPGQIYLFGLCLLVGVVWLCHRVATSRLGWAWCALRKDEDLARALGHDVVALKLAAFCLGANIAVICGAFFASLQSYISPESFVFFESVIILSMVILGGGIRGNLAGVLLGAFALSIVPELFRGFQDLRFPIYGIAMAVAVLAREQGLVSGNWLRYAMAQHIPEGYGEMPRCEGRGRLGISASDISRKFGGVCAVDHFSFDFQPGRAYGIIGHNGAGKTTLINLLSGVLGETSGHIRPLAGDKGGVARRWRWGVARTFQRVKLVDDLDAFGNVLAALHPLDFRGLVEELLTLSRPRRRRREADARRATWALDQVGFPREMMKVASSTLPFGLKRKVELARALARDPSVLLLDEPLSGLAEEEREAVHELLMRLRAGGRRTVIIVEHQFRFMKDLCDQVIFMESGTVARDAEGRPLVGGYAEVLASPIVRRSYFGTDPAIASTREVSGNAQSPLVILNGVDAEYPASGRVLHGVELQISKDATVLVTGLNGAGKTTLLRTIAGIGTSRVTTGSVRYGDADITRLPGHERARLGIAYMAQEERLFPSMRVCDHFRLLCGCGDKERLSGPLKELVDVFSAVGKKWTERAGGLSGGQQQMLALVLALAKGLNGHHPHSPLLLLDEPTAGLQPNLAAHALEAIDEIRQRTGIAVVLTEQQPGAERIATHHYHVEAGHLLTPVSG